MRRRYADTSWLAVFSALMTTTAAANSLLDNSQYYLLGAQRACPYANAASLSPGQIRVCSDFPQLMKFTEASSKLAGLQCKFQMQNRFWNCSDVGEAAINPDKNNGTRESAFTHALWSAALAHTIGKACRRDELQGVCGCSNTAQPANLPQNWVWSGCGDNLHFGTKFAQTFSDIKEKEKNYPRNSDGLAKMLMNLHNNAAGRTSVRRNLRVSCKCHGVSASCNIKTCWPELADFRVIADQVKSKFDASAQVTFNRRGTKLSRRPRRKKPGEKPRKRRFVKARYNKEDLIHVAPSLDYCGIDKKTGLFTTSGRTCTPVGMGPESCQKLCCGRSWKRVTRTLKTKCNCVFKWCCDVTCEECENTETVSICD